MKKVKIDKVIKNYLIEREEILLDDEQPIVDGFSSESKLAFGDMVGGISHIIEDLSIIQVKDNGFVLNDDLHSEDYIEDILSNLESVVERLEYLKGLE